MVGTAAAALKTRQAFKVVSSRHDDVSPNSDQPSNAGSDCGSMDFTSKDVDALLAEKLRAKNKFNYKERCENMMEYIRRLRQCITWFQELENRYRDNHERLAVSLEIADQKLDEMELSSRNREEELNSIIVELRKNITSLHERLAKEQAEREAALDLLSVEKESRLSSVRSFATLSEELKRAQLELLSSNQRISSVNDMYKRLQEYNTSLQQYNCKLQSDFNTSSENLTRIEKEKATIVENLSHLRGQHSSLQEDFKKIKVSKEEASSQNTVLENLVASLGSELKELNDERGRLVLQVNCLTEEVEKYKEFTGKSIAELDNLTLKSNSLEAKCLTQGDQMKILQERLEIAEKKVQDYDLSDMQTITQSEEQKTLVYELQNRLADAELKLIEGEVLRKKLHNTILELKGNIRVFCRIRPILPEDGGLEAKHISYPTSLETLGRGIDVAQNGQKLSFTFDKVFMQDSSQDDVFVEISQLIQSALDGYKVSIFAYGQTGSGKTYTMMGIPQEKGLMPRSLEQIFQTKQSLESQGWKYELQVSMLEIYNETIRDLLLPSRSNGDVNGFSKQYTIKHDANGNTHVSDLTVVDVCSTREVTYLLNQAAHSRSVGKTQMNEQSSRSHFVFTLKISGVNESTEQQVQGVLNLIDLAGSERLSKSGSTGDRLKETQAINKSLSSLSDVIFALAKKEDYIPFRNSKLTYLLQPCLGGDSKTLMFVNISPDPSSTGESLCSLRFAARVNACEIGVPRRNTTSRFSEARLSYG